MSPKGRVHDGDIHHSEAMTVIVKAASSAAAQVAETKVVVTKRSPILAWATNVRWRDALSVALAAISVLASAAAVGEALRSNDGTVVILAAVACLLALAGQTLIRREMLQRLAESRKYWFTSSPRGLAEMDVNLRFVEGNSRLASLLAIEEMDLPGTRLTAFFDNQDVSGIVSQFGKLQSGDVSTVESDDLAI